LIQPNSTRLLAGFADRILDLAERVVGGTFRLVELAFRLQLLK
jgi:hypothetical protein